MTDEVVVETGARLHFGLLAHSPQISRQFGGAGVMVSGIGYRLRGTVAEADEVLGEKRAAQRVRRFLGVYRESIPCGQQQPPPCRINLEQVIPPHAGLGSGTQLGLATARVLAALSGESATPAIPLAERVGRGLRSGLGIHGFERGGFLIDGGKRSKDAVAPLVGHAEFPSEWRFVLVTPKEFSGLSGSAELKAFAEMAPMPTGMTDTLCRILLLQMMPAVIEADFDACSAAIYEFGRMVGEYFAPTQGGVFASPAMQKLAPVIRELGYTGIGQTSWGPTLFVLCRDQPHADVLCGELRDRPELPKLRHPLCQTNESRCDDKIERLATRFHATGVYSRHPMHSHS